MKDAVFLTRPNAEPYYVTEGQEGPVMECSFAPEFRNRTRYEPSWTVVAGDLPRHLTRNGVSFSKQHYELLQTSGAYNLQIRHVVFRRDNGKFFCTVLDKESGAQYTVQANVVVVVEPEKPVITRQPSGTIEEGELVTIECQTTGGNPPPSFVWVFSNRSVVPEEWYHVKSSSSPDRPSVSILQWRVNAEDNEAYLNCQIWNEALPKGEHKDASTTRLNVLYGPKVHAGPVHDYNVEEGERVELTCSANGNPAPSQFEWHHITSGERFAGINWQFLAERKHSGDFRCMATNSMESGADKLTLNVQYGPIVKVKERINPAEGDAVTLECVVDANPPANSIVWSGPNGITSEGSIFKIDSIQRTHSGNYTCTAINALTVHSSKSRSVTRTGQAFTVIDVLRRPGEALITASSTMIAVGGGTTLRCTAVDVGSPEAEYRWLTPSSSGSYGEQKSPIYILERAMLSDNGDYRCMPFNRIGNGVEGVLTIQVIEPSKITRPLPESLIFNAGETSVTLRCEAQGYPAPQFQWLKDGQVINKQDGSTHWSISSEQHPNDCPKSDFCSITMIAFLNFLQPLGWNDKGNYSCKFTSGLQKFVTSSMALSVIHGPVILNERYPSDALAAADVGSTARIVCHVSARPEPEFVWFRNGSEVRDGQSRYVVRNIRLNDKIDEFQSILEIADSMIYDHGPYICRTSNGNGQEEELVFKLQTKSKPQAPRELQLISSLPTSLFVGWRPSFDGGEEQNFQLEYRKVNPAKGIPDSTEPVAIYIDGRNASYLTLYEEDETGHRSRRAFSSIAYMVYNISHLNPLSTYWFRVRARNLIGNSDWTPVTTATTSDVRECAAIPRPLTLYYNSAQQKIDFEIKQLNDDLCVLLLFASGKNGQDIGSGNEGKELSANWRAMDCFDQTPIYDVPSADYLKARLCHKLNLANCSAASEIIVSSTLLASGWMYMISLGAVILFLLFTLCFIIICCQIRRTFNPKNKKEKNFVNNEKRNDTSAPLSQSNTKNTLIHGSQTDSGIFTLGSTPNTNKSNGQSTQSTQGFSTRTGTVTDQWNTNVEPFAYNNDPYLQEYNTQYQISPSLQDNKYDGFIDGFPSNDQELNEHRNSIDGPSTIIHDDQDSDETSYTTNGTRRVMREIIV
ncbi:CBR-IGCM-1 protein [Loa loa]|uniref:CBR-IGCM-1 protein n=1 Tax=Loa loa TaxID=7209 RepID=A0A1S0UJD6_LOALO|nr:CBR-IGCM-1 protein [Loa loa]EJD75800.1 CBR-IGCM-1 protein [Loa loa]